MAIFEFYMSFHILSLQIAHTYISRVNFRFFENVGRSQCSVVDTYWQTETGAHIATNLPGNYIYPFLVLESVYTTYYHTFNKKLLPLTVITIFQLGVTDMKPGSCAFPYFGIQFAVANPTVRISVV